jgi:nitronate monooxygenase/enoyl-[acyl-carrier protein] reductase II
VPRVIRTDCVAEWEKRPGEAAAESERLLGEIMAAVREGRTHELIPFTGQTAGLIGDVRPAAKIVEDLVAEASEAVELAQRPSLS